MEVNVRVQTQTAIVTQPDCVVSVIPVMQSLVRVVQVKLNERKLKARKEILLDTLFIILLLCFHLISVPPKVDNSFGADSTKRKLIGVPEWDMPPLRAGV